MTTLSIRGLRPAQVKELNERAKKHGKTAADYVRSLIERELLAEKSFDEILGPIRRDVRRSGMTEEELGHIVERARTARYRRSRGGAPRRGGSPR